ncbi:hypothetical protein SPRG_00462 [Saprolegnia parasitica CBS 223.65]|uniref:BZIP domain-containing protein n=1 Tax=Saprolegnia parasitica (strain CBS 223.65) TaxID=695850 RepID=A0A067CYQ0_SAPPC|nr:hypothetical protein SPRG_00462 [Saprolegnia parasitica CBS 223.65]KDO35618.1 hypothetical protein SPRG_00462 [Saprolegnia parasitica CBS 223.65]|eukprot:XP_012193946.1 hypothetical protein SPRG_00462 [Saprolegnia parasitica CBS 223.65]
METSMEDDMAVCVDPLADLSAYTTSAAPAATAADIFRDEDAFSWLFLTSDLAPLDQSISFPTDEDLVDLTEPNPVDMSASSQPSVMPISSGIPPFLKRDTSNSLDSVLASDSDSGSDSDQSQDSAFSNSTVGTSDVLNKKKRKRLARNRDSARESRKRRLARIQQNEIRLKKLEMENIELKMRLKIGKEAILSNASEAEMATFVEQYKAQYSDYGDKRKETIAFHTQRVRDLLLPTQVTKMCLYSVEQGDFVSMKKKQAAVALESAAHMDHIQDEAPSNLWAILAKELDISEAQQRQIFARREKIKYLRENLNKNLGILRSFEIATQEKNETLEAEVAQLQTILTPHQATRFIIWVKENPAFMYMLDKLVQSIIHGTDDKPAPA